jgi:hypothetical protein
VSIIFLIIVGLAVLIVDELPCDVSTLSLSVCVSLLTFRRNVFPAPPPLLSVCWLVGWLVGLDEYFIDVISRFSPSPTTI